MSRAAIGIKPLFILVSAMVETFRLANPGVAPSLCRLASSAPSVVAIQPDTSALLVIVPAHSIFSPADGETSYVWVIGDDDTVQQREVELGLLTSTGVTIEAGLKHGERIATAGVHFLSAGQRIRPLTD